ncbi:MAG: bifunctional 2-polyprenyl-6-hydroxyphenol methylase/3-demethylubiquinol 3-O-methyltransferase UbiG [Pseudomonadota bacterium]|nr:bifunctional 2-polyprenyl-6-hydroxyphenol methylase/3-demethylubiquinol 3-O-methyltransferase UbiG [Pseudomonadota bacterium]
MAQDNTVHQHRLFINKKEIEKFTKIAEEWWDPNGKFRPLHKFNPVRLDYIRREVCHFKRLDALGQTPFTGLDILDIGCGGGLLSEPMCRLGATVTGADASEENIKTASIHAAEQNLDIDYQATTAAVLVDAGRSFDVILNMEVIEHVANPPAFIDQCSRLLKPGGIMFLATLNRTLKAYALAIVGAEYVLGWLPKGTHEWEKFITPRELEDMTRKSGLNMVRMTGVSFHPLLNKWQRSGDLGVNYMGVAQRPETG